MTIYRDSKTGRFVAATTYKRSRARGGTRYQKETVLPPKKRKELAEIMAALPDKNNAGLKALYENHKNYFRYDEEQHIIKVSISTTKTRKKFSVRAN